MYKMTDSAYKLLKHDINKILDGCVRLETAPIGDTFNDSQYFHVDVQTKPHLFYHFQFGRFKLAVIYTRDKKYSLFSEKWIPEYPPRDNLWSAGIFGSFDDLNSALEAFFRTCKKCMDYVLDHPVEYMQLDLEIF